MIKSPSIKSIIQQLTFIIEHFDDIVNRKEFLHQLSYEENNKMAELKYNVTKIKKNGKMIAKKRKRNFFDDKDYLGSNKGLQKDNDDYDESEQ